MHRRPIQWQPLRMISNGLMERRPMMTMHRRPIQWCPLRQLLCRCLTTRPLPSIEAAADETIAALKIHPSLLNEVLKRGDEDVRATARRALDRAFDEADVDGDGTVSREEFRNWTTRRYASAAAPADTAAAATGGTSEAAPDGQQLRRLALKIGIPFIGFGFLDNAIMITAGDSIDAMFGATVRKIVEGETKVRPRRAVPRTAPRTAPPRRPTAPPHRAAPPRRSPSCQRWCDRRSRRA